MGACQSQQKKFNKEDKFSRGKISSPQLTPNLNNDENVYIEERKAESQNIISEKQSPISSKDNKEIVAEFSSRINKILDTQKTRKNLDISTDKNSKHEKELKQFSQEKKCISPFTKSNLSSNELILDGETIKYKDGTYRGGLNSNKQPEGNGMLIYVDGSVYIGEFKYGLREGKGRLENEKGVYVGEFNDDQMTGQGKLTFRNLDVYQGNFIEGQIYGYGKYTYKNGSYYEGDFVNSKRRGKGAYSLVNKSAYSVITFSGEWINDEICDNCTVIYNERSTYKGRIENYMKNGEGTLYHKIKGIFSGIWENDKLIGKVKIEFPDNSKYEGEMLNEKFHGKGKYFFPDGQEYVGDFKAGEFEGNGNLTIDKEKNYYYKGYFSEGRKNGKGIMQTEIGIYEGDFKNNSIIGIGKIIFAGNKNVYEGQWENNFPHGKGELRYSDGSIYKGDFIQGIKKGFGEINYSEGNYYIGQWKNDKRHGKGRIIIKDEYEYDGEWQMDEKNGNGKIIYTNGTIYEGNWKKSYPNGNGVLYTNSGDMYEGCFEKGKMSGYGTYTFKKGYSIKASWLNDYPEKDFLFCDSDGKEYNIESLQENNLKIWYFIQNYFQKNSN